MSFFLGRTAPELKQLASCAYNSVMVFLSPWNVHIGTSGIPNTTVTNFSSTYNPSHVASTSKSSIPVKAHLGWKIFINHQHLLNSPLYPHSPSLLYS